jgi:3-hydroxyacyl-[acyl-carrier-protein] dehydratase
MRWDLIDKFDVLQKGRYARAFKGFSGKEDFFGEHFPGKPLVPEPLFIEMIAQTGGVLFGLGLDFKKEVILAKIENGSFFKEVGPPCSFLIEAVIDEEREDGAWISGTVKMGNDTVARVRLLLAVVESLAGNIGGKIVFNSTFLKHFDVYEVAKMSEVMT